jgi:hypothetical protein
MFGCKEEIMIINAIKLHSLRLLPAREYEHLRDTKLQYLNGHWRGGFIVCSAHSLN